MPNYWQTAQSWEKDWWGDCTNTLGEEIKQLLYAKRMGLDTFHDGKSPYNIDLGGISVLDIGGGPTSLLLKCVNFSAAKVVDPLVLPQWVLDRYIAAGVEYVVGKGEDIDDSMWDECWIYNVLQHVEEPGLVIDNARSAGDLIRVFEWINTPTNAGHPQSLSEQTLNEWLHGEGKVEIFDGEANCHGVGYYGIFPTA